MKFNKDMKILDIILMDNDVIEVLNRFGMKCTTCQESYNETLEWAAKINNVDIIELLDELNEIKKL
ncbi:DUF1858 domain-containing protein [Clostridium sp. D2Q-11]|uniref:DUF1858 domain-containing protein n=1 Tax=Anaeromonas frigoriresistens TaxID=2683708 RepID=A0A942UW11_9FIRM|nr:DUF1858 domain-containing protein [Anaeromonas frigoriresistens]MBS4537926.1 DUF1858 domain-containing protein [Anaeromonas frigoriresistens]